MRDKKKEAEAREAEAREAELLYFQNLVPGLRNSEFIQRYREACLTDGEPTEEREDLLTQSPPILTFKAEQKKEFYEAEAKSCSEFCCGGMQPVEDVDDLQQTDNYMVSVGTGALYEGRSDEVQNQMAADAKKEPFGSESQESLIKGIHKFRESVKQREAAFTGKEASAPEENPGRMATPFETSSKTPKP